MSSYFSSLFESGEVVFSIGIKIYPNFLYGCYVKQKMRKYKNTVFLLKTMFRNCPLGPELQPDQV